MALPIIFNLRRQRRRRTERRGLRLLDHADQLTETKARQRNERGEIGKWKRHKTHHQLQKPSGKATELIREMLLSPLNHASLRVRLMFFVFSLMALAIHMKHCLSYMAFYFYPVNYKVLVSLLRFRQLIRKSC